jgi:hypothetical protein
MHRGLRHIKFDIDGHSLTEDGIDRKLSNIYKNATLRIQGRNLQAYKSGADYTSLLAIATRHLVISVTGVNILLENLSKWDK